MRALLSRFERLVMGRKAYKWVLRSWQPLEDLKTAADLLATMRFTGQIAPQLLDGPVGARRILVLAPHPDDEVIGPGGTLIRAVARGAEVSVLYLTSGGEGERAEREAEARAVCDTLGFHAQFAGGRASAMPPEAMAAAMAEALHAVQPDALFLPFLLDDHPDHRTASHALLLATQSGRNVGSPEVWAYQVYTPLLGNVAVDITALGEAKADAIRLYRSQMARRDWAHFALGLNAFNCRLLHGRADPVLIESFFAVPFTDYLALCRRYFAPAKNA